jgi:hypothetical protein
MRQTLSYVMVSVISLALLGACGSLGAGSFTIDANDAAEKPDEIYLVVDSHDGTEGEQCEVLVLSKLSTLTNHGDNRYGYEGSMSEPITLERDCADLVGRDAPPLEVDLIPAKFQKTAGIKATS